METPLKNQRSRVISRFANRLERNLRVFNKFDARYFWLRIGTLILILMGAVLFFIDGLFVYGAIIFLAGSVGFVIVVIYHRRLDRSRLRFRIRLDQTRIQIARMQLDWDSIPAPAQNLLGGLDFKTQGETHPFEKDLNVTGARSLQHLIDTAITTGGSLRLRSWLLNDLPDLNEIQSRQILVEEMKSLVGFRGHLALKSALASADPRRPWSSERIIEWLKDRIEDPSLRLFLLLLGGMSLVNIVLFVLNITGVLPPYWILTLGLYGIIYNIKYRQYRDLFADTYQLGRSLEQFRALFVFLEKYPYPNEGHLVRLCQPFWGSRQSPSSSFRSLGILISAASLQNNPILSLFINAILPWDLFFAHRFNALTREVRKILPTWLDTWYELEALNSLANFAYLNPEYIMPKLLVTSGGEPGIIFKSKSIGHPLLVDQLRICNDFQLSQLGEIVIVSGSNMSGKSTFLKTLGVNLCLAYAGGPVNAVQLDTILFRLFTSINVSDSITDGISYFYAEVKRLKALLGAYKQSQAPPVFFLIDEIYRGTNNVERQIGSSAFVRSLVGGRGVGVISTHDLSLVHLADGQPTVRNVHFREDVDENRMVFDYKLRPGPCPTTNALRIMEIEGLPVDVPGQ